MGGANRRHLPLFLNLRHLTMSDNEKEDYGYEINRHTKNIIDGLIPKRIVPFDYYEERDIDEEVKNWIERSEGEFAVVVGDAGFGKTNLLCNLANELLNEEQYAVFFVKSENLRGKEFDKKILEDFEIKETGLNAFLRKIIDENEKVIFLLDTLDLIATDDGITRLDDFLTKVKGENRVVIGASRPLEFKKIEHLTKKTFALKPFSNAEIQRLFEKYKAFYSMEGVELRLPVLEVCRNPLHMRMLFEVYQPNEIPEDINTQKLYDRYWDKKIAEIRIGALSHLNEGEKRLAAEAKNDLSKKIAANMLDKKEIYLNESDISSIIKKELLNGIPEVTQKVGQIIDSYDANITQEVIVNTYNTTINDAYYDLLDEGVLRRHEDLVEFFHQTFFEYATAKYAIEHLEKLNEVLSNVEDLFYRSIIVQIALQAKNKKREELFEEILNKVSKSKNVLAQTLIIDIFNKVQKLSPEYLVRIKNLLIDSEFAQEYLLQSVMKVKMKNFIQLITPLLLRLSEDKDPDVRKVAARVLPALFVVNQKRAKEMMDKLSQDVYSYVGKTAVESLPKIFQIDPLSAKYLIWKWGTNRWPYIRMASAEALPELFKVDLESAKILTKKLVRDRYVGVQKAVACALFEILGINSKKANEVIEELKGGWPGRFYITFEEPERVDEFIERLSKAEYIDIFDVFTKTMGTDSIKYMKEKLITREQFDTSDIAVRELLGLIGIPSERAKVLSEGLTEKESFGNEKTPVIDLIEKLSKHRNWWIRRIAAELLPDLYNIDPMKAKKLQEELMKDKSKSVKTVAQEAIKFLEEER